MMDAMRKSRRFAYSSFFSVIWNLALLIPHSYALVLAEPKLITKQCKFLASQIPYKDLKQKKCCRPRNVQEAGRFEEVLCL